MRKGTRTQIQPLAVTERNAAAMLDMSVRDFWKLVLCGALPRPTVIGGHELWIVADLVAVLTGSAAIPEEVFTV